MPERGRVASGPASERAADDMGTVPRDHPDRAIGVTLLQTMQVGWCVMQIEQNRCGDGLKMSNSKDRKCPD